MTLEGQPVEANYPVWEGDWCTFQEWLLAVEALVGPGAPDDPIRHLVGVFPPLEIPHEALLPLAERVAWVAARLDSRWLEHSIRFALILRLAWYEGYAVVFD